MFGIWMEILKNVPHSILWLLKSNAVVEENLKKEADRKGVDPDRLIFCRKNIQGASFGTDSSRRFCTRYKNSKRCRDNK